jgi:predicted N-acyltransferase
MAQYMAVALKATIVITKKRLAQDRIPEEVAIETVTEHCDLSLYDYSETEHFHLWKLKEELLSKELVPFLDAIFKLYYDKEESSHQAIIGEIKRRTDYDSVFKLAKLGDYEHFTLHNTQNKQIHLKKYGKHVQIDFNHFQLFKGDRLRMDGFDKVMQFLSNTMQKSFSEFELSKALDIYVFDSK